RRSKDPTATGSDSSVSAETGRRRAVSTSDRNAGVGMNYWAGRCLFGQERVHGQSLYYWIRDGKLRTVRTIGGSQRVLLESIQTLLRQEMLSRVRGADASSTGLSAKFPAP